MTGLSWKMSNIFYLYKQKTNNNLKKKIAQLCQKDFIGFCNFYNCMKIQMSTMFWDNSIKILLF